MGAALTGSGRLRLLETAFEHGIHHFDTAPLYGQGEAEGLLGRFARSRRDRLTITTKFGLLPQARPALLRPLLPVARVVNRRLLMPLRPWAASFSAPRREKGHDAGQASAQAGITPPGPQAACLADPLTAPLVGGAGAAAPPPPAIPYTATVLRQQVERSLRALASDYIDYYLLHECQPHYLNDEVLACLEALVQEGKIRHYGIGSDRGPSRRLLEAYPNRGWIVQIPDRWHDPDPHWFAQRSAPPLFTHSALRLGLAADDDPAQGLRQRWAALTQQDPRQPGLLSEVLLALALHRNPQGCVLFSSRHSRHIRGNAALLERINALAPALAQLLPPEGNVASALLSPAG